ncbi:SH3 domain-containing protein [Alteribacter aurantiacus]|uniref:SH3 domain-containing protein n=1 Tax=Alteribacter aurantiacus TaxID=254410 RepID=UPI000400E8A2|nr:SH3 domain-containing protein [Alteribacter aurantiacus]
MTMTYAVKKAHESNYPNPISLRKGERVLVGEAYDGEEDWPDWLFCTTEDGKSRGWVPAQLIDRESTLIEDYCARELTIRPGEQVNVVKELNGWYWVKNRRTNKEGWIPKDIIV